MCRHCDNLDFEAALYRFFCVKGWTFTLTPAEDTYHLDGVVYKCFSFVHNGNPVWDSVTLNRITFWLRSNGYTLKRVVCNHYDRQLTFGIQI